jgi:hypothetical protein
MHKILALALIIFLSFIELKKIVIKKIGNSYEAFSL